MSKKWVTYFLYFQSMKWATQAMKEERNKPQTFSADGCTGNQRSSQMWWKNEQELLSPEPRTVKNKWAEWLGLGEREGDKGPRPFVPVGATNRDKSPWPPYPLSSPPARAIQLTCFLLFLARERGVLAHFFTTFVKIFDSPSIHRR